MQHLKASDLYLGVGNTITAQTEDGSRITGIVSRRKVVLEPGVTAAEITVRWGDQRSYLFVPYTAIVAINDETVEVK